MKARYYDYFPRFFPDLFPQVYAEVKDKCTRYEWGRDEKTFVSKRASCMFASSREDDAVHRGDETGYGSLQTYDWHDSEVIQHIKAKIEAEVECIFDYVLVHIYETGKDCINYHSDREALNSTIASVSFGAARKFRLRKIGERKGWEKEFRLVSGDMVIMWGPGRCGDALGCQRVYMHSVPKESTVKFPRINLTFRQCEKNENLTP